jgi:hypothetical protein
MDTLSMSVGIELGLLVVFRIVAGESRQHSELYFTCVSILLDGFDDFDGGKTIFLAIVALDDFAKGALSEETNDFV